MTNPAPLSQTELTSELRRLAPFFHDVALPYGLRTYQPEFARRPTERTRVACLVKLAWPPLLAAMGGSLQGLRVLDVACCCGGFSFAAADAGAREVVGIDVTPRYIEQARLIQRARGDTNVSFRQMSIEDLDPNAELFDVVLNFGILYHLEDPVGAMRRLAAMAKRAMVVDTFCLRRPLSQRPLWGMYLSRAEAGEGRDASTSAWRERGRIVQFMPNARAATDLLRHVGFTQARRILPLTTGLERRYYTGRRAAFLALR